ncbi:MAG: hypothetical protein HY444_03810 [Nitrospirae bacterium]|nr:hypothetical protein [Nitrospirota bacterium]
MGQPKNPVIAGVLSGVMPGLGQFYCRQWARGAAFLIGAIAIDASFGVSSGMLELLQSFGAPTPSDALEKLLLGSLLFLAIAIWSIADAVRTAKKSSGKT